MCSCHRQIPLAAGNFVRKRSWLLDLANGWGGRIRTYDTRYQKPMPYHLATPQSVWIVQFSDQVSGNQPCSCVWRRQNVAYSPNDAQEHDETPSFDESDRYNLVAFAQIPVVLNAAAAWVARVMSSKMPKQLAPLPDICAARHVDVWRNRRKRSFISGTKAVAAFSRSLPNLQKRTAS